MRDDDKCLKFVSFSTLLSSQPRPLTIASNLEGFCVLSLVVYTSFYLDALYMIRIVLHPVVYTLYLFYFALLFTIFLDVY